MSNKGNEMCVAREAASVVCNVIKTSLHFHLTWISSPESGICKIFILPLTNVKKSVALINANLTLVFAT